MHHSTTNIINNDLEPQIAQSAQKIATTSLQHSTSLPQHYLSDASESPSPPPFRQTLSKPSNKQPRFVNPQSRAVFTTSPFSGQITTSVGNQATHGMIAPQYTIETQFQHRFQQPTVTMSPPSLNFSTTSAVYPEAQETQPLRRPHLQPNPGTHLHSNAQQLVKSSTTAQQLTSKANVFMQSESRSRFGTQFRNPELNYPAMTTLHLPTNFGAQLDYGTQLHIIPLQPNVSRKEQQCSQTTTNIQPHSTNNWPKRHSYGFNRPVNANSTPSANSEPQFLNRVAVNSYPAFQSITFAYPPAAFNSDLLMPTEPFTNCSFAEAWNFQGTTNQTSTQRISFHQPDASASTNQQQTLQLWLTQQPPFAAHEQLLSYNHQPAIGTPQLTSSCLMS